MAGLVFNPATPLDHAKYVLDKIDIILLMSVNPGFGGQSFIPSTLDKLREARKMIDESGYDIRLEVNSLLMYPMNQLQCCMLQVMHSMKRLAAISVPVPFLVLVHRYAVVTGGCVSKIRIHRRYNDQFAFKSLAARVSRLRYLKRIILA